MFKNFKKLTPNSIIGISSTASPCKPERLEESLNNLTKIGLNYKLNHTPICNYGAHFLSGDKLERASSINQLTKDLQVDAILASRGGYGSADCMPLINFKDLQTRNIPIIGYSDISSLLIGFYNNHIPSIHGPNLTEEFYSYFTDKDSKVAIDQLINFLTLDTQTYSVDCKIIKNAEQSSSHAAENIEGRSLASNLTTLSSILGTKYHPNFDQSILFIEDTGESPYRVHRMLTQLELSGAFENLSGLILGRFYNCQSKYPPTFEEMLQDFINQTLNKYPFPILSNFPFGHGGLNFPICLGAKCIINNNKVIVSNIYE